MDPVVIGIAGGTGSGKTSVALKVKSYFPYDRVELLHHDSYYHDHKHMPMAQKAKLNFDHPEAFQTDLLIEHLDKLRAGVGIIQPRYDYETHSRLPEGTPIPAADIILLEGILVLENEELRGRMDIRIFIDADADERFIRRLKRDIRKRDRHVESIIRQYQSTVRPMHLRFAEPSKRYADLIIPEGAHNEVAIDLLVVKIKDVLAGRKRMNLAARNAGSGAGDGE